MASRPDDKSSIKRSGQHILMRTSPVDNVEKSTDKQNEARAVSEYGLDRFFPHGGHALPGLADLPGLDTATDKKRWMSSTQARQPRPT